jgi:chromatin segregation and condensation protein Rec8/ScpA/Scc1 (kleisin family)
MEVSEQPIHELVELVRNHRLNPWDIDVGKLVTLYARKLRDGETFDIRIPARVLHLAATLLRMKSAYALNGQGDGAGAEDLEELLELEIPDRGELTIEYFVPRKLTLDDLLGALREAISELPRKRVRPTKKLGRVKLDVRQDVDVKLEELMQELFLRIKKAFEEGGSPSLFSLTREQTREELVLTFMLLIFLCSEGKIMLEQTQPFGDIFALPAGVKSSGSEGG